MKIPVERIRNFGFLAHIDAGKTTTTERVLYFTGLIHKIGDVDEGTTETDWMDQERERGISIVSAATTCFWKENRLNIIDTPGHVDFTAEVEKSIRILDGAVIIMCAVNGVEPQTEKVWHQADKYQVPRLVYVNKMDRLGADFWEVVEEIKDKFKVNALAIALPIGKEENFQGCIDLISLKAYYYRDEIDGNNYEVRPLPDDLKNEALREREKLIEKLADFNLDLMEKFLEKQEISEEIILKALREATIKNQVVPVLPGSSFKKKCVHNLLDAITNFLPCPQDRPPIKIRYAESNTIGERELSEDLPFSALVFKVANDRYSGLLIYFRVYSGRVRVGDIIVNSIKGTKYRLNKILRMHAIKREEIEEVSAGDIAATVGLKGVTTGDTICSEQEQIILDSIEFPEPVVSATIEPKTSAELDRLLYALERLALEDPTFKYYSDTNTGQLIVSGMGELHLDVLQERIKREYGVQSRLGKPRVAYLETILHPAVGEEKYIKQTAGKNQFGHVVLEIIPRIKEREKFNFSVKVSEEVIAKEFYPAIEAGVREAMDVGFIAGFPISFVEVHLVGGSMHPTDASEIGFRVAANIAFRNAFKNAQPVLAEPIVKIEIVVHEDYLGDVMNDFYLRQGRVVKLSMRNELHVIDGYVPLSEMFGYTKVFRTITQGRGDYSMEFSHYEELTSEKMDVVLKEQLGIYSIN